MLCCWITGGTTVFIGDTLWMCIVGLGAMLLVCSNGCDNILECTNGLLLMNIRRLFVCSMHVCRGPLSPVCIIVYKLASQSVMSFSLFQRYHTMSQARRYSLQVFHFSNKNCVCKNALYSIITCTHSSSVSLLCAPQRYSAVDIPDIVLYYTM